MKGNIFDIQRFSTHDGPGIRTTVFLKGCSLRCQWCHNPESIHAQPEVLFTSTRCIGCGACTEVCPTGAITRGNVGRINQSLCDGCGACAATCPSRALTKCGREVSIAEVLQTVRKDRPFYEKSGGGVTVSGGEALLQSDFVAALLRACKADGIHTTVDTAGEVPYASFEEVLSVADLFLFDIKAASPALHKQGCGKDNARILTNLHRLSESGASLRLRVPVIPGFNDTPEEMQKIGEMLSALPRRHPLDLLRFHRMGAAKYEGLGLSYPFAENEPPTDAQMRLLARALMPWAESLTIQ